MGSTRSFLVPGAVFMSSTRANEVAEALFELKRADKFATYSAIARRAGFSAGSNGRAVKTALKAVRRDWPHLQWWRAIEDNASIEAGEQERMLRDLGLEIENGDKTPTVALAQDQMMDWTQNSDGQANA
jgi:alkylated DNA nucleotide flippase Atl1